MRIETKLKKSFCNEVPYVLEKNQYSKYQNIFYLINNLNKINVCNNLTDICAQITFINFAEIFFNIFVYYVKNFMLEKISISRYNLPRLRVWLRIFFSILPCLIQPKFVTCEGY